MGKLLRLYQEIMLLAIRDDVGTFSSGMFLYSVAGAMVSELLVQQRLVIDKDEKQSVTVIDCSTTEDEVLDELLSKINSSKKPKNIQHWVNTAANLPKLKHRIASQLCELGILQREEKKFLWVFTNQVYPEVDGTFEDEILERMRKVMFDHQVKPDGRTAALIALSHHADLMRPNFAPEKLRQHKERIKELATGSILASDATKAAIAAAQAAIMVAVMIPIMTNP